VAGCGEKLEKKENKEKFEGRPKGRPRPRPQVSSLNGPAVKRVGGHPPPGDVGAKKGSKQTGRFINDEKKTGAKKKTIKAGTYGWSNLGRKWGRVRTTRH